jgi:hypothetical protein
LRSKSADAKKLWKTLDRGNMGFLGRMSVVMLVRYKPSKNGKL